MTNHRPRLHQIVRAACDETSADVSSVISPCRRDDLVRTRWMAAYVASRHGYTLPEIGRILRKDHSSVLYGLRQIEHELADNPAIAASLERVEDRARELTEQWFERCRTVMVEPDAIMAPEPEPEPPEPEPEPPEPDPTPEAPRSVGAGDIAPNWWHANDAYFRHAMRQAHPEMECAR